MNTLHFFCLDIDLKLLKNRKQLKRFIESMFKNYHLQLGSLNYIFCSDAYLLEINKEFLAHYFYTDIITFDLSAEDNLVNGEVYISMERVSENAILHKSNLVEELHRVIFHGALHLCGFKDKTVKDKTAMRAAEDFWLMKYFKSL